jgi:hypothetical protein
LHRVEKRSISFLPKINKMMLRKEGKFFTVRNDWNGWKEKFDESELSEWLAWLE